MFFTVFTSFCIWTLTAVDWNQFKYLPLTVTSVLITSYHSYFLLPSGIFPRSFRQCYVWICHISRMCYIFHHSHVPWLHNLVKSVNYEVHRCIQSLVCNRPITSCEDAGLRISSINIKYLEIYLYQNMQSEIKQINNYCYFFIAYPEEKCVDTSANFNFCNV
jgi:hypothetical protein